MEIPIITPLIRRRGGPYVIAWLHRLTGLLVTAYLILHIQTLAMIGDPGAYDAKMALFTTPLFVFLEWILAIPVIVHALNGGRLILIESFAFRNDDVLLKTVFVLSGLFVLVMAVLMVLGDQTMSPFAFWLPVLVSALAVSWGLSLRLMTSGLPPAFIFQRVTGGFMLVMIPAHLFFMHLSPEVSKSSTEVIARLHMGLVKHVDALLLMAVLYHAGYGLYSILSDYMPKGPARTLLVVAVVFLMGLCARTGLQLLWSV